ncbi:TetR/AcrR family transcriptional regulator [Nitrospirillum viridazoti]|uniref:TetR family transcriptional regulator n=1 Tax=Nitrospirillum amazonense TaxID=28077 RepID=A0A560I1I4_9PROT|nr:TetR/AcrR family transcriptional regulator [Nitrospirillum amazonense]TWB52786.1 TetR family transcriptional regulator [Nitrospirillum amazonense]
MVRTVGSRGPKTMEAIRAAGLRLIRQHGYEAITLRQLGQEVGIQPGSMYNYIQSKQELLFILIRDHMVALSDEVSVALEGAADPLDRLRRFIRFHVSYHIRRTDEVFIGGSELRSLEGENRAAILAMRRDYERLLVAILEDGMAAGQFKRTDPPVTAYAILAMLTGVCTWYNPAGRMGEEELIRLHQDMILGGVLA